MCQIWTHCYIIEYGSVYAWRVITISSNAEGHRITAELLRADNDLRQLLRLLML